MRRRRRKKIIGLVSYISIAVVIQCFFIVAVCEQRGTVDIGGEYLILPAALFFREQIMSAFAMVEGFIWGDD